MSEILKLDESIKIGQIGSVDTIRTYIIVDNHLLLTRVPVGTLIAIQGVTLNDFFIAMAERVSRKISESLLLDQEDDSGNIPYGEKQSDTIRAVLIGTFKKVEGKKANVFKRGVDSFPQIDRECYLIEGANLQRLMNLLGSNLSEEVRLQLGHYLIDKDAVAIADGNRFFQRHAAVLGSTGSGKSWCVSLILEKASNLKFPNLIVLDMHGEYTPLTHNKKGFAQGFRIAGPGDLRTKSENVLFLPYWLLNREEMLSVILDRSDNNAPNQAARFTEHVRNLKEKTLIKENKTEVQETFTVDSPISYQISELIDLLSQDDVATKMGASSKEIKGDWNGKLTRFISRLTAKIEDRRYGFLFKPPAVAMSYDWLSMQVAKLLGADKSNKGIKIIDFSEVPSDILPIVVGVFARVLYNVQFWMDAEQRTPFTLVCDEAHLYLPVKEAIDIVELRALESFERIAKEGRKYGVSLLVVSQRPSDVSKTILSQCNNFLILRLTNDLDQNVVRRLMPDSMVGLIDILPLLDVGEALFLGDAVLLPTRIKLDSPKVQPHSATLDFWSLWNEHETNKKAISDAIEAMRRQTRNAN